MESQAPVADRNAPPSGSPWKPLFSRANGALAILSAALLIADAALACAVNLRGFAAFLNALPGATLIVVCCAYCFWRRLARLIDVCLAAFWAIVISNLLSALMMVAGRSPRPLIDAELAALDVRLGVSTAWCVHFAAQVPWLRSALNASYALLAPMVLVGLIVPPLMRRAAASRRLILGATFAAILTAAGFALWPAAGPWTTEGFYPGPEQAGITAYLHALKSPGPVMVDLNETAIVSFPSYHVALALVAAVCLGSAFRKARRAVWCVTVLICISTLTTGWHYAVDILGGVVAAVISIVTAGWLERRLSWPVNVAPCSSTESVP